MFNELLKTELLTKEDYQKALMVIEGQLYEAFERLTASKKLMRQGYVESIKGIIKEDIKSKDCQQAYIVSKNAQYGAVFEIYDIHNEEYQRLLRIREDILKLMSFSQSEMKI